MLVKFALFFSFIKKVMILIDYDLMSELVYLSKVMYRDTIVYNYPSLLPSPDFIKLVLRKSMFKSDQAFN